MYGYDGHDLGWCHNCGHFQRVEDAPRDRDGDPICRFCRQEPWALGGVWDAEQFVPSSVCMPCLIRLCVEGVEAYDTQLCEHAMLGYTPNCLVVTRKSGVLVHQPHSERHALRGKVLNVERATIRYLRREEYDDWGGGVFCVKDEFRDSFLPLCGVCFRGVDHGVRLAAA